VRVLAKVELRNLDGAHEIKSNKEDENSGGFLLCAISLGASEALEGGL